MGTFTKDGRLSHMVNLTKDGRLAHEVTLIKDGSEVKMAHVCIFSRADDLRA